MGFPLLFQSHEVNSFSYHVEVKADRSNVILLKETGFTFFPARLKAPGRSVISS